MNEVHAKLRYWTGTNTALGETGNQYLWQTARVTT